MFRLDEGDRGRAAPRRNHRGVSYWTDGRGDERILYITPGYQLIALNAKTGDPIPAFGKNGTVDLFDELDTTRPRDGQIGRLAADDCQTWPSSGASAGGPRPERAGARPRL